MTRQTLLQKMGDNPDIPVLIIGGGINGIGLYRELALQGIDVYLVEKSDFMSGASSASSHMIHGGLRYLENSETRLVQESLKERNRLLLNAPHYVQPLPTTIPIFKWFAGLPQAILNFLRLADLSSDRGAILIKAGLTMYDFYTRKQQVMPRHSFKRRQQALEANPDLPSDIIATATYYDAWITHPERLGLELILDAEVANANCIALNYVRATHAEGDFIVLHDEVNNESFGIKPQIVINATGAWIDFTNQSLQVKTQFIGGTKGSHLIIDNPALYKALNGEMIFYENSDGRVCIIFPYQGKVMAGSTDIHIDNPDDAVCTPEEKDYIFASIRSVLPNIDIKDDDIVFTFCGVRPLPASHTSSTGKISRDHSTEIVDSLEQVNFPIYNLIGGKWTTFRAFSEQVADKILVRLNKTRKISTHNTPIGGGVDYPNTPDAKETWIRALHQQTSLPIERLTVLFERYGTGAKQVADYLVAHSDAPLANLPTYSIGEVAFIVEHERIVHLSDMILHRTLMAILGDVNHALLHELADIIAPLLVWSEPVKQQEIDRTATLLKEKYGVNLSPDSPISDSTTLQNSVHTERN